MNNADDVLLSLAIDKITIYMTPWCPEPYVVRAFHN